MKERLEFSKSDLCDFPVEDWKVRKLTDNYWIKLLNFSNKLGIEGKKIKEIVVIEEHFSNRVYIDFICD